MQPHHSLALPFNLETLKNQDVFHRPIHRVPPHSGVCGGSRRRGVQLRQDAGARRVRRRGAEGAGQDAQDGRGGCDADGRDKEVGGAYTR